MRRILLAISVVTITGGKIQTVGAYVAIGSTQSVVVAAAPSGTTGQCIGILCGITHAN